jgi:hypothetical protein
MPPGFMDDLEGEVIYEKLYECGCVSLFCFPDRRGNISFSAKNPGAAQIFLVKSLSVCYNIKRSGYCDRNHHCVFKKVEGSGSREKGHIKEAGCQDDRKLSDGYFGNGDTCVCNVGISGAVSAGNGRYVGTCHRFGAMAAV